MLNTPRIPPIDDALDALYGACWFSMINLARRDWQIEVEPEYQEKTAFSIPFGLFQFWVMPIRRFYFSASDGTGTLWTSLIILSCIPGCIIIFSRTVQEHLGKLQKVFTRLQEAGLKLKPMKCHFLKRKVYYLGYVVSSEGVQTKKS